MDLYLSAPDTPSLQEMLECDMKCELDLGELPLQMPVLDEDCWVESLHSNNSFQLELSGESGLALMVNPNSVMPPLPTIIPKIEIKSEVDIECSDDEELDAETFDDDDDLEDTPPSSPVLLPVPTVANITISTSPVPTALYSAKPRILTSQPTNPIKTLNGVSRSKSHQECLDRVVYPKPAYSYSCLIAMALKNSSLGCLPVSEIYSFMCEHFPYFKSAPNGWKNSVRHNLSLNKCFEKIEKVGAGGVGGARKGCLWAMAANKVAKMDDEVAKWSRKDPSAIRKAMVNPENLERLERGEMKASSRAGGGGEESEDEEEVTDVEEDDDELIEDEETEEDREIEVASGDESEGEIPPTLLSFDSRLLTSNMRLVNSELQYEDQDIDIESLVTEGIYEELELEDSRALFGSLRRPYCLEPEEPSPKRSRVSSGFTVSRPTAIRLLNP